jgi:hypothetical protein
MKKFLIIISFFVLAEGYAQDSNKVYFRPLDGGVFMPVIPVQLNDSITAEMLFDTGAGFTLDSVFVHKHHLAPNVVPSEETGGLFLINSTFLNIIYDTAFTTKIGQTIVTHNKIAVWDVQKHTGISVPGMYNIPHDDTNHVWELNFDKCYIEVHSVDSFRMPENCMVFPLIEVNYKQFHIQIPLQIIRGNDTLKSNYSYCIDTGNDDDMIWGMPSEDIFPKTDDELLFTDDYVKDYKSWYRNHTVSAVLWNEFRIDSLQINTHHQSQGVEAPRHFVGTDFLKRFNIFFDIKHRQIGLQPLKKHYEASRVHWLFMYSAKPTANRTIIITEMADFKRNYYKSAGLQVGDEIIAIDNYFLRNHANFASFIYFYSMPRQADSVTFDIIRNGQPMKIIAKIDKSIKPYYNYQ